MGRVWEGEGRVRGTPEHTNRLADGAHRPGRLVVPIHVCPLDDALRRCSDHLPRQTTSFPPHSPHIHAPDSELLLPLHRHHHQRAILRVCLRRSNHCCMSCSRPCSLSRHSQLPCSPLRRKFLNHAHAPTFRRTPTPFTTLSLPPHRVPPPPHKGSRPQAPE